MPSHIPSQLKLDSPVYEEDIGDLTPYSALPSSRASSATINSSIASTPGCTTDNEVDEEISPNGSGTPRKQSFGFHLAPSSSHSLSTRSRPRPQVLPPVQKEDSSPRPLRKEIDALEVDPISVAKIRRWILGIAVGESTWLFECA